MKRAPHPKRFKGTWYVSFEIQRTHSTYRTTEPFQSEQEAKAFARIKLADGSNVNAGTFNPHTPKRIITSAQIVDWLDEPDG
jgi:hypothetical protein